MQTQVTTFTARCWTVALCALLLVGLTGCLAIKATTLPEVTVEITDDAIKTPAAMPAGFVAVTFVDRRTAPKDGVPIILKLNGGVSDDEFTTWLMQPEPAGPPPAALVVHGAPLASGVTSWPEIDLSPGTYYVVCFLPDFASNPPLPHVAHGMLRRFTVQ